MRPNRIIDVDAGVREAHPAVALTWLTVEGVDAGTDVSAMWSAFVERTAAGLRDRPADERDAANAWRAAAGSMFSPGTFPTADALAGDLTTHPLLRVCRIVSLTHGVPIAAFDAKDIVGELQLRRATGEEQYAATDGSVAHPDAGDVILADGGDHAYTLHWLSDPGTRGAVTDDTREAVVIGCSTDAVTPDELAAFRHDLHAALDQHWRARA